MYGISDTTPIAALTVADLKDLLKDFLAEQAETHMHQAQKAGRLVYGLKGISDLFGVSHLTAQRYKDGLIKEAVMQNGRKIVVDADLALKLFNERKGR